MEVSDTSHLDLWIGTTHMELCIDAVTTHMEAEFSVSVQSSVCAVSVQRALCVHAMSVQTELTCIGRQTFFCMYLQTNCTYMQTDSILKTVLQP